MPTSSTPSERRGDPLPPERVIDLAHHLLDVRPDSAGPDAGHPEAHADRALRHLTGDHPRGPLPTGVLLVAYGALDDIDIWPGAHPAEENRRRAWLTATSCLLHTALHTFVTDFVDRIQLGLFDAEWPAGREAAVRGWLTIVDDPTSIPATVTD